MGLYKLPLGIRIPKDNEYPKGYDVKSINERRNSANIINGFIIKEVSGERFSHYAEVNIDADKIWDLFCSLSKNIFDDVAYGILGVKDEDPKLSNFTKVERILSIFQKFKLELTNDGYLEFGVASYDENSLNEIFVSSFKYIKVWTNRKELLIKTLNSFGIELIDDLQFIDEFPVVSEALANDNIKGFTHYSEVIEFIENQFQEL